MEKSPPNRYKTLREKEKLLIKSNFSFSHIVFKILLLQTRKNQGLFGKELIVYRMEKSHYSKLKAFTKEKLKVSQKQKPVFGRVANIMEKAENAGNQHCHLLFHDVFSTFKDKFYTLCSF